MEYDNRGRILAMRTYSTDTNDYLKTTYSYDTFDNNTQQNEYRKETELINEYIYKYDVHNKLIESQSDHKFGRSNNSRTSYAYDSNNNLIWKDVLVVSNARTMNYRYKYDKMNNWIQGKQFVNGVEYETIERDIEYYE